ncbi:MAG: alpha/beta fold hydrolase [Gammaproteobacteria bacterium]|nr:alpha/beta fold hydrolase [Gammaproteobacteria bacterium]
MTNMLIDGPCGHLEVALQETQGLAAPYALICHPHPLHGGSMNNKVVTMSAKAYEDMGCNVVRFNYRGVGESQGEYGDNSGEVADAMAVVDWLLANREVSSMYFAGFSFGAYIAAQAAANTQALGVDVRHVLLIAPSVLNSPFDQVTPFSIDTSIIMGDADEIVPFDEVQSWADQLYPPVEMLVMEEASHFFHGRLTELKGHIKGLFD